MTFSHLCNEVSFKKVTKFRRPLFMNRPKLSPVFTNIKNKSTLSRIWHWQSFIREWELLEDRSFNSLIIIYILSCLRALSLMVYVFLEHY